MKIFLESLFGPVFVSHLIVPYASRLTSILAIASLVMGNAAGWMHVGHHCSEAHQEVQQDVAEHSCCCHHHCHQDDEKESDREKQPVHHEHDSDSCSICQNFFASRHGLPAIVQEFQWQPFETRDDVPVVSEVTPERVFFSSLSSRGPPCA